MKSQKACRNGFSLIELVCVISIIGTLVAMVLPAVNAVRESARNTACKNNLRQLSLAAQSYASVRDKFPPGTLGYNKTLGIRATDFPRWDTDPEYHAYMHRNQNTSWLVFLLPFVEKNNLADQLPSNCTQVSESYESYRNSVGGPEKIGEIPEVRNVARTEIALLNCPSDSLADSQTGPAGSQPIYDSVSQTDGFIFFDGDPDLAGTNYVGCSGAYSGGSNPMHNVRKYDGVFGSRVPKSLASIKDGTSNSILCGENIGTINAREREYKNPWFFATLSRGRSDLYWGTYDSSRSPGLEILGDGWYSFQSGFGSKHTSGVNFSRTDGSVQSISRDIDWQTLYSLCGIADGNTVNY